MPSLPDPSACVRVLGMHRSGTSAVASALAGLGVRLGPSERLLGATGRNPGGYFEHTDLTAISELLLLRLGGSWDRPPALEEGWSDDPSLVDLEDRAREILERDLSGPGRWAWKDPRLCLTHPFWERVVPGGHLLLCLREPLEVARSTAESVAFERGPEHRPTLEAALSLWARYLAGAFEAAAGRPALPIDYGELLAAPEAELERVARFLGLDPDAAAERIRVGAGRVTEALRRERAGARGLPAPARELRRAIREHRHLTRSDAALEPDAARKLAGAARSVALELAPPPPVRRVRLGRRSKRPRLSVALCTYRGERYLPELLASIAAQTRPPAEVIVCDDRSDDATLEILRDWAASVAFPVRLEVNPSRLGSTRNFERAIGLASGDVVLLADQDDAWLPGRLEAIASAFRERPDLAAFFHDADLIGPGSEPLGRRLWEALGITDGLRREYTGGSRTGRIETLLRGNLMTGACMAFRTDLRELILPIPWTWVQDAWIGIVLSGLTEVSMDPRRLVRYRLHPGQQIGIGVSRLTRLQHFRRRSQLVRRMTKRERPAFLEEANHFRLVARRLREVRPPVDPEAIRVLEEKAAHFLVRGRLDREASRWALVRGELRAGRYHRYSNGWPSVAKDLLLLDRLGTT